MKTAVTIDSKDWGSLLTRWRGSRAMIWLFHVSRNRMAINLSKMGEKEALFIVAVACERITGPFRWDGADVKIATQPPNEWGETRSHIVDKNAGFELVCADVVVFIGSDGVPADPFDGFVEDGHMSAPRSVSAS